MEILIVEDEAIVALDLESKLESMDYKVVGTTDNYDEAVKLASEIKISLALCDINIIGEKSGIDIARVFRDEFNIPCIFLTAFSNDFIINKAKEVGAYGYILKPYSKKDVFSAIEIAENRFNQDQLIIKKNLELEDLVAERTKDLIKVNQRLEEEMDYTLKLQGDVQNATNKERKRIAQELHDGISQKLTASKFALGAIAKSVQLEGEWNDLFQEVVSMIEESMREIRSISHQLTPSEIAKSGLSNVLQGMFDRLNHLKIIQANLTITKDLPALGLSVESAIYRIIQELINNTIKHAGASAINLECDQTQGNLIFTYNDNGKGFNPNLESNKGIGLTNMYDRALSIGAQFEHKLKHGKGTTYVLTIKI